MARPKKKPQTNDNLCFGPVRHNTVGMSNNPVERLDCVSGTPSLGFSLSETDEKDIHVTEKISIVNCSRSDAPPLNNRPIPPNIVNKSCLHPKRIEESSMIPPVKNFLSSTIEVKNLIYTVDFMREKHFKNRRCVMHSIQSWKVSALVKAHTAVMDGKQPQNMYARDEKKQHNLSGWIICARCKRAVCSGCASLVLHNILNDKPIQSTIQKGETWCSLISEFLQISAPAGFLKAIKIPGHISHCCRLGCEVRRRRNQISRARKKTSAPGYTEMLPNQRNDGLLHYAPYRVVIAPSFRFFDTLCVAEQGYMNDVFHQEPVYHSVIPNDLAKQYDMIGSILLVNTMML
jgi:hypothetical protein